MSPSPKRWGIARGEERRRRRRGNPRRYSSVPCVPQLEFLFFS
ncbi:hypothetical protein MUK42_07590 [Musa troglodytarum]|uniref:Uncharacterized protein n=1 Tax=Musa troglodytarum TaxID=320322 RepID=A0A9E7EJ16_9LILI|nr:hypothetical protein MUK42_07590 [Musa troglodytarum]